MYKLWSIFEVYSKIKEVAVFQKSLVVFPASVDVE